MGATRRHLAALASACLLCLAAAHSERGHEEYFTCMEEECNLEDRNSEEYWDCEDYCYFKFEHASMSSGGAIFLVLLVSLAVGIAAGVSARLLECTKQTSAASGAFAGVASLVLGLLPLSAKYPVVCAQVAWGGSSFGLLIYPIVFLGASGSFFGFAVAAAYLRSKAPTGLGKLSVVYLAAVTVFNVCGIIGVLHVSCHDELETGLPFYIGWLVSSFITNLVLQKIVVIRAKLTDESRMPRVLHCLFCVEVVMAVLLFGLSMFFAIARATMSGSEERQEQTEEERQQDRDNARAIAHAVTFGLVVVILLFVVFDLFFSCASSMAMRNSLREAQSRIGGQAGAAPASVGSAGLFSWSNAVERAVFFARLNLVLVVASVTTTTLFYLSFMVTIVSWVDQPSPEEGRSRVARLFIAWLLDSLFNDVCVVFVGFGPIDQALSVVSAAVAADIIGEPTASGTDPAVVVSGQVVGTPVGGPRQDGNGKENNDMPL